MTREEQITKILKHYDPWQQRLKAIEELTELTEVLIKDTNKGVDRENIIDEIADVYIMLEQIKMIYHVDALELDNQINKKIERQLNRIKGGNV